MKATFFAGIFILAALTGSAQINISDSSVQVVAYWDKGEKQNYAIATTKTKMKGVDTLSNELMTYEVEITVLDSTGKSYTIQWLYKNIHTSSSNATIQKLMNITSDMKVVFKTDELGSFMEVVNWKDIKDYIQKTTTALSTEFKDVPGMDEVITQLAAMYSTKEAIESVSIKDIQQFHSFHGAKYTLGKRLGGTQKVPNLFGGEPFDSDITIYLDELNEADNSYIVSATQEVNQEQLTNATFNYLATIAKNMKVDPPTREDLKELKNETLTSSQIHGTGWVIYSVQTTTVTSDDVTHIEERTMRVK